MANLVIVSTINGIINANESSIEAIKALKEYGIDVKVLTGDNEKVTLHVCSQVGINTDNIMHINSMG